mgnify:FL=1
MFDNIKIIALGHGFLLGMQYFAPYETDEDDLHELNIYLFLFCISLRWK